MGGDDDGRGEVPRAPADQAATTPADARDDRVDAHATTGIAPPKSPATDRTPSHADLHARVRTALFDGSALPEDYTPGTVVAERYRIAGILGRGGMGEVYRAHDLVLGEEVAIKFIPQPFVHRPEFMERFVREVRLARHITHANVCRVHDIGQVDGRTFLSMEYIDGEDLASLLRRIGRLSPTKAVELAQQLCAGLAALHDVGVLHRDLKPHNLMVDGRGQLKVTDFGLAAEVGALAEHEFRDGTPAYMAPEQAAGREVTTRSDIYALGLVLYEILTGQRYDGIASASGKDASAAITGQVKGVPREVEEVILACLAQAPEDRPPSALAVAAALPGGDPVAAALAAGRTPSVDALLSSGRGRPLGRLPGMAVVVFIALALLGLSVSFPSWTVLGRNPETLAPAAARHEAREFANHVAWAEGEFVEHDALRYDDALLEDPAARIPVAGRSPVLFDYRRQGSTFRPRRGVSMQDPPYVEPGAVGITFDGRGRLRSFRSVPAPSAAVADAPADYSSFIEAAQLEATLEQTPPDLTPPTFADHRGAWVGYSETLAADVRVEAASLGGTVVAFEVLPQWDPRFSGRPGPPEAVDRDDGAYLIVPLTLLLFGGIAWTARRTLDRGTADPRGASRVALAVSILLLVSVLRDPDLVAGNWHILVRQLNSLIGQGLFTYWIYLVLDMLLRRYLPGSMSSWVRLVRGHVRDPSVARDALLGVALSVAASSLARVGAALDGVPELVPASIEGLGAGLPEFGLLSRGAVVTPVFFLMFAGLVRIVRRRWIASFVVVAAAAGMFLLAAMNANAETAGLATMALAGACFGLALTQIGLLGAVVFSSVRTVLAAAPLTLDPTAWFATTSWTTLILITLLVGYGWRYGVAAQADRAERRQ